MMAVVDKMKNLKMAIIPTWRCNLNPRCAFCSQDMYASCGDELPVSLIKEQTDDIVQHSSLLELVGGEITTWKYARDYMNHVSRLNPACNLMLHTNGISFNSAWSEFCVERNIQPWVSLNGSSEGAYVRAVGVGATGRTRYRKIKANLDQYLEAKQRLGLSVYPRLRITMVVTGETQHDMVAFASLAGKLDTDVCFQFDGRTKKDGSFLTWDATSRHEAIQTAFRIKELLKHKRSMFIGGIRADEWRIGQSGDVGNDALGIEECSALLDAWKDAGIQSDYTAFAKAQDTCGKKQYTFEEYVVNGCYTIKKINGNPVCSAPWEGAYIYPNGNVKVCCFSSRVIGNIKQQPLASILDDEPLRNLQQELLAGNTSSCAPICVFRHAMDWEIDCMKLSNCSSDFMCTDINRKCSNEWFDAVALEAGGRIAECQERGVDLSARYAYLAMLCYKKKNYKRALQLWDETTPADIPSWMVLRQATSLFAVGKRSEAEELVGETYNRDPKAVNGNALLGWFLAETGLFDEEADAYFHRDITCHRLSAGFALNYACALADSGDIARAEEQVSWAYEQSVVLKDGYARLAWRAWIHRKCISAERAMDLVSKDIVSHRISREWFVRFTSRLLDGAD